jgi:hypothetical protein
MITVFGPRSSQHHTALFQHLRSHARAGSAILSTLLQLSHCYQSTSHASPPPSHPLAHVEAASILTLAQSSHYYTIISHATTRSPTTSTSLSLTPRERAPSTCIIRPRVVYPVEDQSCNPTVADTPVQFQTGPQSQQQETSALPRPAPHSGMDMACTIWRRYTTLSVHSSVSSVCGTLCAPSD